MDPADFYVVENAGKPLVMLFFRLFLLHVIVIVTVSFAVMWSFLLTKTFKFAQLFRSKVLTGSCTVLGRHILFDVLWFMVYGGWRALDVQMHSPQHINDHD